MHLAIVSANAPGNVAAVLGADLVRAFGHIDGGASILGKAPRLKRVARRLGLQPGQALYVGDVTSDAQAAAEAGMDFGAVTWGYGTLESFRGHTLRHVFDTPSQITEVVLSARVEPVCAKSLGSIAPEG